MAWITEPWSPSGTGKAIVNSTAGQGRSAPWDPGHTATAKWRGGSGLHPKALEPVKMVDIGKARRFGHAQIGTALKQHPQ